ncbi:MAG: serine/threonine protein kinase [Labilithrix sp.]|nr:serine/threonine protein kinase [Labilithrix sp.]
MVAQDVPSHLPSPVNIGDIVDKYRVEHVVGVGAMGLVVAARHTTLDQIVAIKFLVEHRFGSRDESIARFLGEARAAARIQSDHVCRVSDVGMLPTGVPFMIMEHLEGNDLEEEIIARGQLDLVEAVDYVLQACDAIAAAHQLGIVHRDLKPANLFLARRPDGSRRVKVLDFGISKATTGKQRFTRETRSLGTPAYMPPEQITDPMGVDHRADIWALGAILYEVLTGQMAFVGGNIKEVLDRVLAEDPCPIPALRRDVPPELTAIVSRALARDRDARWPTAATFARALAPFGSIGVLSGLASIQREVGSLSSISALRVSPPQAAMMGAPAGAMGSGAYAAYVPLSTPHPMMGAASSGQYPVHAPAPSVDAMVSSLPREMPTQPDPGELSRRHFVVQDWAALQTRRRRARTAILLMVSALLLASTAAVLVYRVARPRLPRAERGSAAASSATLAVSAAAPLEPATLAPPAAPPAEPPAAPSFEPSASAAPSSVQPTSTSVRSASSAVHPARHPRVKPTRK